MSHNAELRVSSVEFLSGHSGGKSTSKLIGRIQFLVLIGSLLPPLLWLEPLLASRGCTHFLSHDPFHLQSQQELNKCVSHYITLMLTLLFPFLFIQTLFPLVSPPLLFWCDDSLAWETQNDQVTVWVSILMELVVACFGGSIPLWWVGVLSCSIMSDFATPWTVAWQALLSRELSREEY